MKKFALLFATVLVLLNLAACNDTETEWVSSPTIVAAQAAVATPEEGGSVTVGLTVSNPTNDGQASATATASWVTVVSCTASSLTLSVPENPDMEPRTASVTVTYSYTLAGARGTCSCDLTVVQSYGNQPVLTVQPTAVTAGVDGGTCSFSYTVVNPASDGAVSASCDAQWISSIDCSKEDTVEFAVAGNDGSLRQTAVTLSYTWGNESLRESVTVVQDCEDGQRPSLTVSHTAVTTEVEGGAYSFTYTVDNPAADGVVTATTSETWISGISTATDGTVTFNVDKNTGKLRQGEIDLTYTYALGSATISETVTVVQDYQLLKPTGTYTCYAKTNNETTSWTLRIFNDDGTAAGIKKNVSRSLTYLIDGLTSEIAGAYEYYNEHKLSAGAYVNDDTGTLHVPTQVLPDVLSTEGYYLGFTPCTSTSSATYSSSFPELVFSQNDDGELVSDYGVMLVSWKSLATPSSSNFSKLYYDLVYLNMRLVKVSDDIISLSAAPTGEEDFIDGLETRTGMTAK